jgi:uncharacterized protein (DUF1501 family)
MDRRGFLASLSAFGAAAGLVDFGILGARAARAAASDDYQALVCVFLFGGNDANNMLVPVDSAGYANYASIRGPLALPQAGLVPLVESAGSASLGLHADLAALEPIWSAGQLAGVLNVGTLLQPLTKADYMSVSAPKPTSLFSHIDQQAQWQTSVSNTPSASGWGGRITDQIASLNSGATVPPSISVAGNSLFLSAAQTHPLAVPATGAFKLKGVDTSAASVARQNALQTLLTTSDPSDLVAANQIILGSALNSSALLNPILTSTGTAAAAPFAGLTTSIASQLLAIAKLIEARSSLGAQRQVFFASLGGFDTHTNQISVQSSLFQQLGPALKAFYDSMNAIGAGSKVTAFTLSDFARTLQPNTGGGSDHGWGSHQLVMGGAVKGQKFYGTMPTLALGGPDDAGNGRWIPTTAVDQYAATLASWFGVDAAGLATVLPNLSTFSSTNLGFV